MTSKRLLRQSLPIIVSVGLFFALVPLSARIIFKAAFETGNLDGEGMAGRLGEFDAFLVEGR